jgi:hypothetical protein
LGLGSVLGGRKGDLYVRAGGHALALETVSRMRAQVEKMRVAVADRCAEDVGNVACGVQ